MKWKNYKLTRNEFLRKLILAILRECGNISEFKLYAALFLLSFPLEEEFKASRIDVDEFRIDMLKKMEGLLK